MPEDPELRQILNAPLEVLESLGLVLEETELRDLPYSEVSRLIGIEEASYFEPLIKSPRVNELLRKDHINRWARCPHGSCNRLCKGAEDSGRDDAVCKRVVRPLFSARDAGLDGDGLGRRCIGNGRGHLPYPAHRPRGPRQRSASEDQSCSRTWSAFLRFPSPADLRRGGYRWPSSLSVLRSTKAGFFNWARAYEQATTGHEQHPALG